MKSFSLCFFILTLMSILYAGEIAELSPEQAAYDVKFYGIDLKIDHATKSIQGSLLCRAQIVDQIDSLVLDLDNRLTVDSVIVKIENSELVSKTFTHRNGKLNIQFPSAAYAGDLISAVIYYNGVPIESQYPPWTPGFVWDSTPSGDDWIGVCCELDGADIWIPCKDHPSDEPDSVRMKFTVPDPLVCVSNGVFLGSYPNADSTTTYEWFVSGPINNYNITLYAAEYDLISDVYQSISGNDIPFNFWVIPENYDKAVNYLQVFKNEFDFIESVCGPYPFGHEKHGWANSSYYGMEHQTIVAYGNDFSLNVWGYDYIHFHELAHEWWGNFITAKSWSDVWIHEGLASYMEALYIEHLSGMNKYHIYMNQIRTSDSHQCQLAPYEDMSSGDAFDLCDPYHRGAWVMHTLRYHLGDDAFFDLLKRWLYPDQTDFNNVNGRQCRIVSTDDMKNSAEAITGTDLDPFFNVFLRERWYPILHVLRSESKAEFIWEMEKKIYLDLDVPISINGVSKSVDMSTGTGSIDITESDVLVIDPQKWILMGDPVVETSIEDVTQTVSSFELKQNYPNPFNPETEISFSIPKDENIKLSVYNTKGELISVLADGIYLKGFHSFKFNGTEYESGLYFYQLSSDKVSVSKKMLMMK